jgi:membrane protein required for colicin V production
MQTYDLLMLLVLVAATMFGFWKGMAWQLASLASLVVSYLAALQFSERLAPTFGDTAPWNRFVAMLAIYIVTSFIIWTVFRLVSGIIDKVRLEAFDKQLGAMFGFAKGVLLCVGITFFAVTLLPPAQGELIVGSQSGQYIVAFLNKADAVMPPELHEVIDPYLHKVQQRLNAGGQSSGMMGGPQQAGNANSGWQLPGWPSTPQQPQTPPAQFNWPQQSGSQQQPAPAWPSQSQKNLNSVPQNETNPYSVPREPRPFQDPYSAQRPTGGTF